jgi:broad specificity phosphatase PhoE
VPDLLVLVRHGQTHLNAEGRVAGRLDPPLTELGAAQAQAAADAVLAMGQPTRVIASPLLRARQTAACLGLPVEVDDRWIELDFGIYDGRPLDAAPWARFRADSSYIPEGGESLTTLGERVRAACDELGTEAGMVVVVSHVSPIKAAVAWTLDVPDAVAWRLYLAPASLTMVRFGEHGPSLAGFNITPPRR